MLNTGVFAADTAWPTRLLGLVMTIAGIFLAGSLIGLIANAIDQKVDDLRRGRNVLVEAPASCSSSPAATFASSTPMANSSVTYKIDLSRDYQGFGST